MAETRFLKPQKHISQKVRPGGPSMEQAILQAVNAADDLIGQYQGRLTPARCRILKSIS